MNLMTRDAVALAIPETSQSRGLAEQMKDMEKLLQAYREQNRFLTEYNIKLEKTIETLVQSGGNRKVREDNATSLFDTSRDAMLLHDISGTIVNANKNSADMFGCPKKKMNGRSVVSLFTIDQRRALAKHLQNAYI